MKGGRKAHKLIKTVHWENKTGILFKMCLKNQEEKSWGKEKNEENKR